MVDQDKKCYFCKEQAEIEVVTGLGMNNKAHRFNPICFKCLAKTRWGFGPVTRPLKENETNMSMKNINTSSSGTEINVRLKKNEYEPELGTDSPGWINAEISIYQTTDAVVSQVISLHNISVEDLERYSRKFKQAADKLRAAVEIDTWPTNDIVIS
jgi:hypothetical protein